MKAAAIALGALLPACTSLGGDPLFEAEPDAEPTIQPTLDSIQQVVFGPMCGCHRGAVVSGGLHLEADMAHGDLVGVASICDPVSPSPPRVVPGDSAGSFLVQKLAAFTEGTPVSCGGPMPDSAPPSPVTPEMLAAIRQWIDDGAEP